MVSKATCFAIIHFMLAGNLSLFKTGEIFGYSSTVIFRIQKNWFKYGIYSSSHCISSLHPRKCTLDDPFINDIVMHRVKEKPSTTLRELKQEIFLWTNIHVSEATISRHFKKHGYTYKKLYRLAIEANEDKIRIFMNIMHTFVLDARQLVFVDESHRNDKTSNRNYGRAPKNCRAIEYSVYQRGTFSLSLILAGNVFGPIEYDVYRGTIDTDRFFDFLFNKLMTKMNAYPGHNSILILDNASIHNKDILDYFAYITGCLIFFLPPYCPYLNIVEHMFNAIKMHEKRKEIHGDWMSIFSICDSVEQIKNMPWFLLAKELRYF